MVVDKKTVKDTRQLSNNKCNDYQSPIFSVYDVVSVTFELIQLSILYIAITF